MAHRRSRGPVPAGFHQVDTRSATPTERNHHDHHTTARRITFTVAATSTILAGTAAFGRLRLRSPQHTQSPQRATGHGRVLHQPRGHVHLNPGLRAKSHAESVVVTGTLDGCSAYGSVTGRPGQLHCDRLRKRLEVRRAP